MNINIDTSNIDLVHNPDILALVLKSLPKAHIVHVEFFNGDTYEFVTIDLDNELQQLSRSFVCTPCTSQMYRGR